MFNDVAGDLKKRVWKRRLIAVGFVVVVAAAIVYFRVQHPDNFSQTVDIAQKTIADIKGRLF